MVFDVYSNGGGFVFHVLVGGVQLVVIVDKFVICCEWIEVNVMINGVFDCI